MSDQQIADALIRSLLKTGPGRSPEQATSAVPADGATAADSTLAASTSGEAALNAGRTAANHPLLYPPASRSSGAELAFEARLTARPGAMGETAPSGRVPETLPGGLSGSLSESWSESLFRNSSAPLFASASRSASVSLSAAGVSALSPAGMDVAHEFLAAGEGNRQEAGGQDTHGRGEDPGANAQQNINPDAQPGGAASSAGAGAPPSVTSSKAWKNDGGRDSAGNASESVTAGAASTSSFSSNIAAASLLPGSTGGGSTGAGLTPRLTAPNASGQNWTEGAARTSIPAPADPPAASLTPRVHELTVRVNQIGAPAVDLQVTQRQGQVHVAVRTPDSGLQTSLRQNLPDLVNALDRAGFRAETSVPHGSAGMSEVAAVGGASETAAGNLNQNGQPGSEGNGSHGNGSGGNSQGGASQDQSALGGGAQGRRPPQQQQPQPHNAHAKQNWRRQTETTL